MTLDLSNEISIGPFTLHVYGLMIAIGFLSALGLCLLRAKKQELDTEHIWDMFYYIVIGGLLGAKLLYIIVELPNIIKDPGQLKDVLNGFVVYGGIIGGIFAGWLACKVKKKPFLTYFDLVMPAVSLAQGFGRIGCVFAGCCYGRVTDSAFHVIYEHSDFAPEGVKLIPTQIISSLGDFILCGILIFYASKKPKSGRVAAAWMTLYGIGRYIVEILRNDDRGGISALSTSQIISIVMVAIGIALWIVLGKKNTKETLNESREDNNDVREED